MIAIEALRLDGSQANPDKDRLDSWEMLTWKHKSMGWQPAGIRSEVLSAAEARYDPVYGIRASRNMAPSSHDHRNVELAPGSGQDGKSLPVSGANI